MHKDGFSSLKHVLAKHKDEVPDVLGSNQNIQPSCKTKLKLTELKRFIFQKYRKTSQDECSYVTAILTVWNFSRFWVLLQVLSAFTVGTEEYCQRR